MIRIQKSSFFSIEIYEIGKYPVTIVEYMHFAKVNKKHLPIWKERLGDYKKMNLTDNAPIIGVDWHDAVAYCNWLNNQQKIYVYRLPTKSEWQYACNAGGKTKLSDKYAWYGESSSYLGENHEDYRTHIVGEKLPNPWGIFDMYGNVEEWCQSEGKEYDFNLAKHYKEYNGNLGQGDWGDDRYAKYMKTLCGGSWFDKVLSPNFSNKYISTSRLKYVGFRLLRTKRG